MPKTAISVHTKKSARTERKTAVERPHKKLTEPQERMADLASDLLLNGGEQEDVNSVLTALLRHDWRRKSFNRSIYASAPAEIDRESASFAARHSGTYFRGLAKHWPETNAKQHEQQSERPAPNTVAEMMRANVRASLREEFEMFLTDSDALEETWLFNEVLMLTNNGDDIVEHFCGVMETAEIYVRVPWQHKARVQEFVNFLQKEAAA